MKDIQRQIAEKIQEYSSQITATPAELIHSALIPKSPEEEQKELIARRSELVQLSNSVMQNYHVGPVDGCGWQGSVNMDAPEGKFRRVIYACAGRILDKNREETYKHLTYDKFDKMSMVQILDTAMGCIAANELELAMLGICYVMYQDKFELTNAHELERIERLTAPEEAAIIDPSTNNTEVVKNEQSESPQHDLSSGNGGDGPEAA
jgi:hypothetical protein